MLLFKLILVRMYNMIQDTHCELDLEIINIFVYIDIYRDFK